MVTGVLLVGAVIVPKAEGLVHWLQPAVLLIKLSESTTQKAIAFAMVLRIPFLECGLQRNASVSGKSEVK